MREGKKRKKKEKNVEEKIVFHQGQCMERGRQVRKGGVGWGLWGEKKKERENQPFLLVSQFLSQWTEFQKWTDQKKRLVFPFLFFFFLPTVPTMSLQFRIHFYVCVETISPLPSMSAGSSWSFLPHYLVPSTSQTRGPSTWLSASCSMRRDQGTSTRRVLSGVVKTAMCTLRCGYNWA